MMTDQYKYRLGFLGAGNMAEAIARGVIAAQLFRPTEISAADPVDDRRDLFGKDLGVDVTADSAELIQNAQTIVLAVKPQAFPAAAAPLADLLSNDQALISIMAGIAAKNIEARFPGVNARVVRAMPNLLIDVGAGVAGIAKGTHATQADLDLAVSVFNSAGSSLVLDESQIDAVTAVSGSGPAYFFYFVEAITQGGIRAGLSLEQAQHLAKHTALGAAKMMLDRADTPAELRAKVTSKGGTTHAAIESMNAAGVPEAISAGVVAAWQRAKELGG